MPSAITSVLQQYLQLLNKYVPILECYPPLFTAGFIVFCTLVYVLSFFFSVNEAIALSPWSPFQLDLNRLSFYPLGHMSFFHLFFNMFSILVPLSQFEKENGSVHCGIVLNVLATIIGLLYSVFGILLYPNTSVIGASAWVFAFSAYEAHRQSLVKPKINITSSVLIPTIYSPFVFLILCSVLAPGSSFMGHLFGIFAGYLLSLGYLTALVEPPSKVVQFIESKLDPLINLIPSNLKYYREIECKALRDEKLKTSHITSLDTTILPTHATIPRKFGGQGHVLGAA